MIEPTFNAPIPGTAMTRELGARPWQRPYQYSTIEDVTNYYTSRFRDRSVQDNILSAVQTNVPLTSIANSVQLAGVMQGLHSIDLGVLVSPIIVELMKITANAEEVEYNNDYEDKEQVEEDLNRNAIQLAALKVEEKRDKKEASPVAKENEEVVEQVKGLMARGTQ